MMRYCSTHLNRCLYALAFVFLLVITSCKEDKIEPPDNYIARVGDEYLTKEELSRFVKINSLNNSLVENYIRNWIKTKVLLHSALENNLSEDKEYLELSKSASEQLLINFYIRKILLADDLNPDNSELREYYETNIEMFKLESDLFVLNIAEFDTEIAAIKFSKYDNPDFMSRTDYIRNKGYTPKINRNDNYFEYNFPSKIMFDKIKYLNSMEYSNVIEAEQNKFLVVQLVNKMGKGSIGSFELMSNYVREVYIAEKKQVYLDKVIERLYDDFEIEINKDLINYEN